MPKPPPIEYFEVTLRCPKEMLGEVVSDFNRRGLTEVSFNLVTSAKTFTRNTSPEVSSLDFLRGWIADHPTFKAKDAVKAFRDDGRGLGTSAYHALTTLVDDGVLKKMAEGQYARADVKALPKPAKAKKAKPKKVFHDVSAYDFTLRLMSRNHGKISSATLKRQFEADGRHPSGTGPVLSRLVKDKKIKMLGEGMYELMPKKTEPKTTNGAATVAAEA